MIREELVHFIKSVQLMFCMYLFEYEYENEDQDQPQDECEKAAHLNYEPMKNRLSFPYCCKIASNLIASYLSVHTGYSVKCYAAIIGRREHSWCECEKLDLIVDCTGFQFELSAKERESFNASTISVEYLDQILAKYETVFSITEYPYYQDRYGFDKSEITNLAQSVACGFIKDTWTLDSFMRYVKIACGILIRNDLVMTYK